MAMTDNRRIRVFVSSTFRDMVEERNELMSHAWPQLRRLQLLSKALADVGPSYVPRQII